MNQLIILSGLILIFVGMILIVTGSLMGKEGKVEFGIAGFIGPIPFGFSSSRNMLYFVIGSLFVVALLLFLLTK